MSKVQFEQGYVLFRVRALTYDETDLDLLIPGKWSVSSNTPQPVSSHTARIIISTPRIHESDSLNWQYSASYAEEGKKKEVVSYFDGSLRSHQVVTKINTDNQSIVGETYYDHQGRAAIQALPAPTGDDVIGFYQNFNRNTGGQGYNRDNFDLSPTTCDILADPMATTSGASRYYSPANPDKTDHQAYVPDAELYPFTHVEYEPDNTGRIRRQSGVGPTHQLGSDHETKYFYGKPSQEHLNRLFASEVGYFSHYKKNMVIDPNGQVSVSYMDQQGRTIATALAGNTPENLSALDSNKELNPDTMTIDILDNQPVQPGVNPLVSSYHHLVTTAGYHHLNYELDGVQFTNTGNLPGGICLDCVYDLVIDVVDECGERPYLVSSIDTLPIITTIGTIDNLCSTPPQNHLDSFTVYLDLGKYVITRTLSVNQEALQEQTETYLTESSDVVPLSDFINEAISQIDESLCDEPDCEKDCEELLGESATQAQLDSCKFSCEYPDICQTARDAMIGDFMPGVVQASWGVELNLEVEPTAGGQYALYEMNQSGNTVTYTASDLTSYLTVDNQLGIHFTDASLIYLDDSGNPAMVYNTAGELVTPNELTLEEFINSFQPSWAEALLPYHPESCMLDFCFETDDALRYNFLMASTDSYAEAYELGLLDPLGMYQNPNVPNFPPSTTSLYPVDPFFTPGGIGEYSDMATYLLNNPEPTSGSYTLWEVAALAVASTANYNFTPLDQTDACTRDMVWHFFRAMYLAEKNSMYEELQANACPSPFTGEFEDKAPSFPAFADLAGDSYQDIMANPTLANINAQADADSLELLMECVPRATSLSVTIMEKLVGCSPNGEYWDTTSTCYSNIRAGLIEVMLASCNTTHPFGASTTPDGVTTPSGYTSFADVLADPTIQANCGGFTVDLFCNADLITFPAAYDHEYGSNTASAVIDTCACDHILYSDSLFYALDISGNLPDGVSTAEDYFEYTYDTDVQNYDSKVCQCSGAFELSGSTWESSADWVEAAQTTLLSSNEYIDYNLTCTECTSCSEVRQAFSDYAEQWSYSDPRNLTSQEVSNFQIMVTTHLNDTLNMDMNYQDYETFLLDCNALANGEDVCNELTPQGEAFTEVLNEIIRETLLTDTICICQSISYGQFGATYTVLDQEDAEDEPDLDCNDVYYPVTVSDTLIEILVIDEDTCAWSLEFVDPEYGFDLNNIIYPLQNVRPHPNTSAANPYQFLADVQVAVGSELVIATIQGYSECYEIWDCITDEDEMELCNSRFDLPYEDDCLETLTNTAIQNALNHYETYIDSVTTAFQDAYQQECMSDANNEAFDMTYRDNEHHYTLYYYDQAGNLIRTIPPEGVEYVPENQWGQVNTDRDDNMRTVFTEHRMETRYKYNSLNQLTHQTMPDHDNFNNGADEWSSRYFYDRLGRIIASQNSKQYHYDPPRYSYTRYDSLGRITEAGELKSNTVPTDIILNNITYPDNWSTNRLQVTKTHYDRPLNGTINALFGTDGQRNLRNRVATIVYQEDYDNNPNVYDHASHFSYDIHGNVNMLVQENTELAHLNQQYKTMTYDYDLISGNVHEVRYQVGEPDQFFHRYEYDGDNRITNVMTSPDGVIWDEDARYTYYQHGPLARSEIGDVRVQGCDYAYTIQGWIKGVNSNTLNANNDIGKDGTNASNTPKDVYSYGLHYYEGDYQAIGGTTGTASDFMARITGTDLGDASPDLFNGNISKMVAAISPLNGETAIPVQGSAYRYDQLNRILSSQTFTVSSNGITNTANSLYNTNYSYDANGNILTLMRHADNPNAPVMDYLAYHYPKDANGKIIRNRLLHVNDTVSAASYTQDIDDQGIFDKNNVNYDYDEIGNLKEDKSESIKEITWRVDGKVQQVIRTDTSTLPDLLFKYDASGNRITKAVFHKNPAPNEPDITYTHYVRDASGNVMAVYRRTQRNITSQSIVDTLRLGEQHLYGSSRLGIRKLQTPLSTGTYQIQAIPKAFNEYNIYGNAMSMYSTTLDTTSTHRPLGAKQFELSNHLGNVLATVSDRKLWDNNEYVADVAGSNDYYPFGMLMPGRGAVGGYRFGFNGVEKEPDINENKNFTFYRIQDTEVGRWWSIDSRPNPSVSPYAMMEGKVIWYSDVLGDTLQFNDPTLETAAQQLAENSSSFRKIYDALDNSKYVYEINLKKIKGFTKKGGFNLPSGDITIDKLMSNKPKSYMASLAEEMIHAYQGLQYGYAPSTQIIKESKRALRTLMENELYVGYGDYTMMEELIYTEAKQPNILMEKYRGDGSSYVEVEAKLIRELVRQEATNSDRRMNFYIDPGSVGNLDFGEFFINNGSNTIQTEVQVNNFFQLQQNFQNYYRQFNLDNGYDSGAKQQAPSVLNSLFE